MLKATAIVGLLSVPTADAFSTFLSQTVSQRSISCSKDDNIAFVSSSLYFSPLGKTLSSSERLSMALDAKKKKKKKSKSGGGIALSDPTPTATIEETAELVLGDVTEDVVDDDTTTNDEAEAAAAAKLVEEKRLAEEEAAAIKAQEEAEAASKLAAIEAETKQRKLLEQTLTETTVAAQLEEQKRVADATAAKEKRIIENEIKQRDILQQTVSIENAERSVRAAIKVQEEAEAAAKLTAIEGEIKQRKLLEQTLTETTVAAQLKVTKELAAKEIQQRGLLTKRLEIDEAERLAIKAQQEAEAAAIAEKEAKIAARKEAIVNARKQPKSEAEEKVLAEKYLAISDIGERAFTILVDLGMVELTLDPTSDDYDASNDDELAPENVF